VGGVCSEQQGYVQGDHLSLKNLETSGNLTAVREISGIVREKILSGKLFIVNFMFGAAPVLVSIVVA